MTSKASSHGEVCSIVRSTEKHCRYDDKLLSTATHDVPSCSNGVVRYLSALAATISICSGCMLRASTYSGPRYPPLAYDNSSRSVLKIPIVSCNVNVGRSEVLFVSDKSLLVSAPDV